VSWQQRSVRCSANICQQLSSSAERERVGVGVWKRVAGRLTTHRSDVMECQAEPPQVLRTVVVVHVQSFGDVAHTCGVVKQLQDLLLAKSRRTQAPLASVRYMRDDVQPLVRRFASVRYI
jgi:hypothetical protein